MFDNGTILKINQFCYDSNYNIIFMPGSMIYISSDSTEDNVIISDCNNIHDTYHVTVDRNNLSANGNPAIIVKNDSYATIEPVTDYEVVTDSNVINTQNNLKEQKEIINSFSKSDLVYTLINVAISIISTCIIFTMFSKINHSIHNYVHNPVIAFVLDVLLICVAFAAMVILLRYSDGYDGFIRNKNSIKAHDLYKEYCEKLKTANNESIKSTMDQIIADNNYELHISKYHYIKNQAVFDKYLDVDNVILCLNNN